MTIKATWSSLSARIRGLVEASRLAADLFANRSGSTTVIARLQDHASAILSDLKAFQALLRTDFPHAAAAITRVNEQIGASLVDSTGSSDMREVNVRSAIIILAALDGEISYLLRDTQDAIRSRAERAFEHLQRSILVDADTEQRWQQAFNIDEPHCEALGALHLLQHAIWAFKVHADKGRTDLVYQDRLTDTTLVERVSEGLVLTEWKRYVAGGPSVDTLANRAREQAENYSAGVLAGIELTKFRYIVIVSEHGIAIPGDLVVDAKTYRHVNIQVDPQTASKAKVQAASSVSRAKRRPKKHSQPT